MFSVIIPMAGCGQRSKLNMNKALWPLNSKPLFLYSYELFKKYDAEIILVCNKNDIDEVKKIVPEAKIVLGGDSRAESVYNGILEATNDICLIHDAARPFITKKVVDNVLKDIKNNSCVYVGMSCVDTVRDKRGGTVDRNNLVLVQTPQAGYKKDFIKAFEKAKKDNITLTDDISYLEKYLGYKPTLVEGNRLNYKLTTPDDFKLAESLYMEDKND